MRRVRAVLARPAAGLFHLTLGPPPTSSPWSNTYEPALADGAMPSERLRTLEIQANSAFDAYREARLVAILFAYARAHPTNRAAAAARAALL